MEQWQTEALEALLGKREEQEGVAVDISGVCLYLGAPYAGESRYHVVTLVGDTCVAIDQIEAGERYQQRVVIEEPEFFPLARTLVSWYLRFVQQRQASCAETVETEEGEEGEELSICGECARRAACRAFFLGLWKTRTSM